MSDVLVRVMYWWVMYWWEWCFDEWCFDEWCIGESGVLMSGVWWVMFWWVVYDEWCMSGSWMSVTRKFSTLNFLWWQLMYSIYIYINSYLYGRSLIRGLGIPLTQNSNNDPETVVSSNIRKPKNKEKQCFGRYAQSSSQENKQLTTNDLETMLNPKARKKRTVFFKLDQTFAGWT